MLSNTKQQTRNITITFIQRRPNMFNVGPTLHKCYTNILCLLGFSQKKESSRICSFLTAVYPWRDVLGCSRQAGMPCCCGVRSPASCLSVRGCHVDTGRGIARLYTSLLGRGAAILTRLPRKNTTFMGNSSPDAELCNFL